MIIQQITLAVICLSLSAIPANASDTLMHIYALAQTNDHQLRAAKATYYAEKEAANIALAGLRPSITGTASLSRINSDTSGTTPAETDTDRSNYSISLTQPLIDFSAKSNYDQGKVQTSIAEINYESEKQSLILRTAQAYFDTLRAIDQLTTDKAEEKAQSTLLEQTRQRYEVGLISINDVHETQAAYDNAVANRINSEANVGIQYDGLSLLTNKIHTDISPLKENFPVTQPNPSSQQAWVDFALQNNLSLKASELNAEVSRIASKTAKNNHLPTLNGVISYAGTDSDVDTVGSTTSTRSDNTTTTLSLNLSIPLYSGGSLSALERQAAQNAIKSREDYLFARRSTIQSTRSLYLSVTTDIAQINARKQAIISSEGALEATKAGYEAGTRDIVDVVDAQSSLFQAQRNYLDALYDYIINTLSLKQSAGNLHVSDLELLEQSLR